MVRAEIPGQKPRVTADRAKRRPGPPRADADAVEPTTHRDREASTRDEGPPIGRPPIPAAAYSIGEFCASHRLSESMYFKLRNQGLGPDEMSVGSRRIISFEAAERWRRARESTATAAFEGPYQPELSSSTHIVFDPTAGQLFCKCGVELSRFSLRRHSDNSALITCHACSAELAQINFNMERGS
jgi:hypothetical protein